jgi:hypothetical protein
MQAKEAAAARFRPGAGAAEAMAKPLMMQSPALSDCGECHSAGGATRSSGLGGTG